MTTACTNCVRLAAELAEVNRKLAEARCSLEEVTAYAEQQHDRVNELCRQISQRTDHEGNFG